MAVERREPSPETEALVRRHTNLVYRIVREHARDADEADDIAQEILIAIDKAWPRKKPEAPEQAWVVNVAMNVVRRYRDKVKRYNAMKERHAKALSGLETVADVDTAGGGTIHGPTMDEVWEAIGRLPKGEREAFRLRHEQGLSVAEAARQLKLAEGTIKAATNHARRKLRAELGHVETLWRLNEI